MNKWDALKRRGGGRWREGALDGGWGGGREKLSNGWLGVCVCVL